IKITANMTVRVYENQLRTVLHFVAGSCSLISLDAEAEAGADQAIKFVPFPGQKEPSLGIGFVALSVVAQDRRGIELRIGREGDERDVPVPCQGALKLGHAGAHLGTRSGTAREDERGNPYLAREIRSLYDAAAAFGQREIGDAAIVIIRRG